MASASTGFKIPKPERLTEHETVTSFKKWQKNILFHLSVYDEFAKFIDPTFTWQKSATLNRGLVDDPADAANRKTAVQKNIVLDRMLGLIAQFAPDLINNDIVDKSTSLNWIWDRIRRYYQISLSEVNFLKINNIKRNPSERYETLHQRIVAHVEDNLLTAESGIEHDGAVLTRNEEMTPTVDRLIINIWLNLIHPGLPALVSRVYAHDLQKRSLKDDQPQICEAMDELLAELNSQDDAHVNLARSSYEGSHRNTSSYNNNNNRYQPRTQQPRPHHPRQQYHQQRHFSPQFQQRAPQMRNRPPAQQSQLMCILCKLVGRQYNGHDIRNCFHVSGADRVALARSLETSYEGDIDYYASDVADEASPQELHHSAYDPPSGTAEDVLMNTSTSVQRVSCNASPFFFAFYAHHPCKILIDSGATSTMISFRFATLAGLVIKPTLNSARQLDKSAVPVKGEVKFTIHYGTLDLVVDGLVCESLSDCDILAGVPFGMQNEVVLPLHTETIIIKGITIPYGSKPASIQHDVYRMDSVVLRNNSSQVLLPGEFVEFTSPSLSTYEGEIAIEPRVDSPLEGQWPAPAVTRVINGSVRIPNDSSQPIHLPRSSHIGQIRRVTTPEILQSMELPQRPKQPIPPPEHFSDIVSVDPDQILSSEEQHAFRQINRSFDNRFNPKYGKYNGNSGPYKADITFGQVLPPPCKPCLPYYNSSNLQVLQEEADKLEALGVLARPEDVGVEVLHASPSFLRKKPDGSWRFVTSFVQLSQYVKVPPTLSDSIDEVLRKLASWKYLIKTDLTAGFFQIPVTKKAMQYLGTVTPFKGLRVYTSTVMGAPGSSEHLHELLCRVFGDMLQEGFLIKIADDLHVCGNTIAELLRNWSVVLQRLEENNLSISAKKTVICPKRTTILGWIWESGTITVSPHKILTLTKVTAPKTCKQMRSYIGAFKAMSRCIPMHSSLMSPLENSIKGLDSSQHVTWTEPLLHHFEQSKEALKSVMTITIPTPSDQLILTTDASPVNDGIGATLFLVRMSALIQTVKSAVLSVTRSRQ